MKKLTALLLTAFMVLSLLPAAAFAADPDEGPLDRDELVSVTCEYPDGTENADGVDLCYVYVDSISYTDGGALVYDETALRPFVQGQVTVTPSRDAVIVAGFKNGWYPEALRGTSIEDGRSGFEELEDDGLLSLDPMKLEIPVRFDDENGNDPAYVIEMRKQSVLDMTWPTDLTVMYAYGEDDWTVMPGTLSGTSVVMEYAFFIEPYSEDLRIGFVPAAGSVFKGFLAAVTVDGESDWSYLNPFDGFSGFEPMDEPYEGFYFELGDFWTAGVTYRIDAFTGTVQQFIWDTEALTDGTVKLDGEAILSEYPYQLEAGTYTLSGLGTLEGGIVIDVHHNGDDSQFAVPAEDITDGSYEFVLGEDTDCIVWIYADETRYNNAANRILADGEFGITFLVENGTVTFDVDALAAYLGNDSGLIKRYFYADASHREFTVIFDEGILAKNVSELIAPVYVPDEGLALNWASFAGDPLYEVRFTDGTYHPVLDISGAEAGSIYECELLFSAPRVMADENVSIYNLEADDYDPFPADNGFTVTFEEGIHYTQTAPNAELLFGGDFYGVLVMCSDNTQYTVKRSEMTETDGGYVLDIPVFRTYGENDENRYYCTYNVLIDSGEVPLSGEYRINYDTSLGTVKDGENTVENGTVYAMPASVKALSLISENGEMPYRAEVWTINSFENEIIDGFDQADGTYVLTLDPGKYPCGADINIFWTKEEYDFMHSDGFEFFLDGNAVITGATAVYRRGGSVVYSEEAGNIIEYNGFYKYVICDDVDYYRSITFTVEAGGDDVPMTISSNGFDYDCDIDGRLEYGKIYTGEADEVYDILKVEHGETANEYVVTAYPSDHVSYLDMNFTGDTVPCLELDFDDNRMTAGDGTRSFDRNRYQLISDGTDMVLTFTCTDSTDSIGAVYVSTGAHTSCTYVSESTYTYTITDAQILQGYNYYIRVGMDAAPYDGEYMVTYHPGEENVYVEEDGYELEVNEAYEYDPAGTIELDLYREYSYSGDAGFNPLVRVSYGIWSYDVVSSEDPRDYEHFTVSFDASEAEGMPVTFNIIWHKCEKDFEDFWMDDDEFYTVEWSMDINKGIAILDTDVVDVYSNEEYPSGIYTNNIDRCKVAVARSNEELVFEVYAGSFCDFTGIYDQNGQSVPYTVETYDYTSTISVSFPAPGESMTYNFVFSPFKAIYVSTDDMDVRYSYDGGTNWRYAYDYDEYWIDYETYMLPVYDDTETVLVEFWDDAPIYGICYMIADEEVREIHNVHGTEDEGWLGAVIPAPKGESEVAVYPITSKSEEECYDNTVYVLCEDGLFDAVTVNGVSVDLYWGSTSFSDGETLAITVTPADGNDDIPFGFAYTDLYVKRYMYTDAQISSELHFTDNGNGTYTASVTTDSYKPAGIYIVGSEAEYRYVELEAEEGKFLAKLDVFTKNVSSAPSEDVIRSAFWKNKAKAEFADGGTWDWSFYIGLAPQEILSEIVMNCDEDGSWIIRKLTEGTDYTYDRETGVLTLKNISSYSIFSVFVEELPGFTAYYDWHDIDAVMYSTDGTQFAPAGEGQYISCGGEFTLRIYPNVDDGNNRLTGLKAVSTVNGQRMVGTWSLAELLEDESNSTGYDADNKLYYDIRFELNQYTDIYAITRDIAYGHEFKIHFNPDTAAVAVNGNARGNAEAVPYEDNVDYTVTVDGVPFRVIRKSEFSQDKDLTAEFADGSWTFNEENNAFAFDLYIYMTEEEYYNEQGTYKLTLVSQLGEKTGVAMLSGGGWHTEGDTVTLRAQNGPVGSPFLGWFNGETLVSSSMTFDYTCTADNVTLTAKFGPAPAANVTVMGPEEHFAVDGEEQYGSDYSENRTIGSDITVTYIPRDGYTFLYWTRTDLGYGSILGTDPEITVPVLSSMSIKAVDSRDAASGSTAQVVFYNATDSQILSSKTWRSTGSADSYSFPDAPPKLGYNFAGWKANGTPVASPADIIAMIDGSTALIEVRPYYTKIEEYITVTVIYPDGTEDVYENVPVGSTKNITAKQIEGREFSCWADAPENGQILSYEMTFHIKLGFSNVTYYALYDEDVTAVPTITLTSVVPYVNGTEHRISCTMTRTVPEGYTFVRSGFKYTSKLNLADASGMAIDGSAAKSEDPSTVGNATYTLHIKVSQTLTDDGYIYVRGYLVYDNEEGERITLYTDIYRITYNNPVPEALQ